MCTGVRASGPRQGADGLVGRRPRPARAYAGPSARDRKSELDTASTASRPLLDEGHRHVPGRLPAGPAAPAVAIGRMVLGRQHQQRSTDRRRALVAPAQGGVWHEPELPCAGVAAGRVGFGPTLGATDAANSAGNSDEESGRRRPGRCPPPIDAAQEEPRGRRRSIRPRPAPPASRPAGVCSNGRKMRSRSETGTPGPSSDTSRRRISPPLAAWLRRARRDIDPAAGGRGASGRSDMRLTSTRSILPLVRQGGRGPRGRGSMAEGQGHRPLGRARATRSRPPSRRSGRRSKGLRHRGHLAAFDAGSQVEHGVQQPQQHGPGVQHAVDQRSSDDR